MEIKQIAFSVMQIHYSLVCNLFYSSILLFSGSTGYPDFTNPEMRALWVRMFAYDQYEVGLLKLI